MTKRTILLCGPPVTAIGGGPTHIQNMLASPLRNHYKLIHFETGSRGTESPARDEGVFAKTIRFLVSPFTLAWRIVRSKASIVHLNSAATHKGFWRDSVYSIVCKVLGRNVVVQLHGGSIRRLGGLHGFRPPAETSTRGRRLPVARPLVRWTCRGRPACPDRRFRSGQ